MHKKATKPWTPKPFQEIEVNSRSGPYRLVNLKYDLALIMKILFKELSKSSAYYSFIWSASLIMKREIFI